MKILKTNDFVSERIKAKPITNAEWDVAKKSIERHMNIFGLTENDLAGEIKAFPMGVVVKMIEEQEEQGNKADVKVFQKNRSASEKRGGFSWAKSTYYKGQYQDKYFWHHVISNMEFDHFFERYPEYRKYNLPPTPNKYKLTKKDIVDDIKNLHIGIVVRMLEEQEMQGNKTDVKVFQKIHDAPFADGGFDWDNTEAGKRFWELVLLDDDFFIFYEKYPTYSNYNIY